MPNSIKKIREYVGFAKYFRFLIPHFSENATQLTKLTKSNSGYKEGDLPIESQMLAINKDRSKFISLSSAEVHACSKMGVQFVCPFVSMASQSEPRDCLKAIFLGDARASQG